jgi:hypothetical protein
MVDLNTGVDDGKNVVEDAECVAFERELEPTWIVLHSLDLFQSLRLLEGYWEAKLRFGGIYFVRAIKIKVKSVPPLF